MKHQISFPQTAFPPVVIAATTPLSTVLTIHNSPLLFGCRTGICGTCLVHVTGDCAPPTQAEQEVLDILAPGEPQVRLACQLQPTGAVALQRYRV